MTQKVVNMSDLTPAQRRLVLALINAGKHSEARKPKAAVGPAT